MGRRKRNVNNSPQKKKKIQDSEGNEQNGYQFLTLTKQ
jgi:hypothetical protein